MPLIFHIPHSSTHIPHKYMSDFKLSPQDLAKENIKMADSYTDELFFDCIKRCDEKIIFPISRLLVDVERFPKDKDEPMSEIGMGMIYQSCHDLTKLRRSNIYRNELYEDYYKPHHKRFSALVKKHLDKHGQAMIIDCHSFPKNPWPYELNKKGNRPEICLGTDNYHTNTETLDALIIAFSRCGFEVDVDTPFSGSIVPLEFYNRNNRVKSIMIEIRRDLYMEQDTGNKNASFTEIKLKIREAIEYFRNHF